MIILRVIKENELFPVGAEFLYNEGWDAYVYTERTEEIGDEMSQVNDRLVRISPSFYEANKEFFNQVKLEDQDEKNKNIEAEENTSAENESKDTYREVVSCDGCIYSRHAEAKNLQREEVEEAPERSESEGNSIQQEGPVRAKDLFEKNRSKDKRIARYTAVEQRLENWAESYDKAMAAFAESFDDIKTSVLKLKQELR